MKPDESNTTHSLPKDLGLKIGSPKEVLWTAVLKNAKNILAQAEEAITIQKEIIIMAGRKVKEEQRKGKPLNKAE